ncbi:protein-tyrosine phosphatase family protein [Caenimonas aquaedulcis]|uniref:Tyrosine-protein phosphatase n=1 Tax=Caenimonas aquaedulcis TaxID=2793270 RepID=A0A931H3B2_9BURK|nr:tyrosine-protein phosphatase [Caenimonas aquaedulcis]MBG9387805.1 tyrosine-protein phosphatase [Caenimonas aquaedulcis]
MSLRPVLLPVDVPGSLWLGAMPGRFGSWNEFEAQARRASLRLVVCLTPQSEVKELSPAYQAAIVQGTLPFGWLQVAMPNYGVPADQAAFRRDVGRIVASLKQGDAVMLHCAAGIGRTGSTAACVLKALGLDTAQAIERVREAGSNPENAAQAGFVDWF